VIDDLILCSLQGFSTL